MVTRRRVVVKPLQPWAGCPQWLTPHSWHPVSSPEHKHPTSLYFTHPANAPNPSDKKSLDFLGLIFKSAALQPPFKVRSGRCSPVSWKSVKGINGGWKDGQWVKRWAVWQNSHSVWHRLWTCSIQNTGLFPCYFWKSVYTSDLPASPNLEWFRTL